MEKGQSYDAMKVRSAHYWKADRLTWQSLCWGNLWQWDLTCNIYVHPKSKHTGTHPLQEHWVTYQQCVKSYPEAQYCGQYLIEQEIGSLAELHFPKDIGRLPTVQLNVPCRWTLVWLDQVILYRNDRILFPVLRLWQVPSGCSFRLNALIAHSVTVSFSY